MPQIYLENIPPQMMSRRALSDFFYPIAPENIVDVKLTLKLDKLQKKYDEREALFPKLEHARNVLEDSGKRPTHKSGLTSDPKNHSSRHRTYAWRKYDASNADNDANPPTP